MITVPFARAHIIKLETRYMKQRRKGLGLKVQVIKKLESK
jgi:hypothetical protein